MALLSEDCAANTLSNALDKLCSDDIAKSEILRASFRLFFEKCTAEQCWQLIPPSHKTTIMKRSKLEDSNGTSDSPSDSSSLSCPSSNNTIQPLLNPDTRNPSTCVEETSVQQDPPLHSSPSMVMLSEKYFRSKIPGIIPKHVHRLKQVTRGLREAKQLSFDSYEKLWSQKNGIFESSEHGLERFCRLQQGLQRIKSGTAKHDCAARLTLVFMNHQVNHLACMLRSNSKFKRGEGATTAAFDQLVKISNIPLKTLKLDYTKSINYLHLIKMGGPGSLLELGSDVNSFWEKHMNKNNIKLVLEYRKSHLPAIEKRAQSLNVVAARTIVRGFLAYGWSLPELFSSCSSLIELIKPYCELEQFVDKELYQGEEINRHLTDVSLNREEATQGQQLPSGGNSSITVGSEAGPNGYERDSISDEQVESGSRGKKRGSELPDEADGPPIQRRHVDIYRSHDSSLSQSSNSVTHGREGSIGNSPSRDAEVGAIEEHAIDGRTQTTNEERRSHFVFNNAQEEKLDKNLQEPFRSPAMAMFQSGLGNHEQCIVVMFPQDWERDVTFSIRTAGLKMIELLDLQFLLQVECAQGQIQQYSNMPNVSLHMRIKKIKHYA
ncbi:hypothetical protein DSL72_004796 [Monilinia vaccinii-corymbosi]|uniref:Uncharacterized protein n=1 Tax=Monilinia vaccinii-corymbosi TaxID=61207 RepID=A0A8A3P330_9HELO|nr:hypothetical protein DSL72_004796 [Monilinia vaccinii-corymbosi]